jgi:hypothetical protein
MLPWNTEESIVFHQLATIYIIKGNVPAEKQSTTFFWEEIF